MTEENPRMNKNLILLLLFSEILFCGSSYAKVIKKDVKTEKNSVSASILEINKEIRRLNKAIEKKKAKETLLKTVENLRVQYRTLSHLNVPQKNQGLLVQYCDASLGVLTNLERTIQQKFWRDTEESLIQLENLNKEMNKDFKPTFWQRFKFWMSHLFK